MINGQKNIQFIEGKKSIKIPNKNLLFIFMNLFESKNSTKIHKLVSIFF
jgi:hypothetical protein